jgi:penicillin amidase
VALDAPRFCRLYFPSMTNDSPSAPQVRGWRRWLRFAFRSVAGVLLIGLVLVAIAVCLLRASLADLDGREEIREMTASVWVERDALGVVTITASNRLDAARALGFVHGQERFFQMDQLRRAGSGELAALFGPALLPADQRVRLHQPRAGFHETWKALPIDQRMLMSVYADGVNAGLAALKARPPEYLLLRTKPQEWLPEDTLAVNLAMRFVLEDAHGDSEIQRELLHRLLPPAAFAFFGAPDSGSDAAIDDTVPPPPRMPTAEEFSWRTWSNAVASSESPEANSSSGTDRPVPGSNNWAVDGRVSGTGSAILADDMHLPLGVPGIWFRARLRYHDAVAGACDVTGFTLPGTPAVVVGSNGHIAWGFTSAGMDQCDLVELEFDPANPRRYRTPAGWKNLESTTEEIVVSGSTNAPLQFDRTIWGPVIEPHGLGRRYALCWAASRPEANNLRLIELERTRNTADALRLAPQCGIANNNFVVADRAGVIGWTLIGRVPERFGFEGDLPTSWADGTRGWLGLMPPTRYPRIESPSGGRLWTANNRVAGSDAYRAVQPRLLVPGARARQIRDGLRAQEQLDEKTLWSIYRDDRAEFLADWQKLLVETLAKGSATNAEWQQALEFTRNWGGRAATNSVGFRLVFGFHRRVGSLVFEPLVKAGQSRNPEFGYWNDTVLSQLVSERPGHLLNPRFASYESLFTAAADTVFASLREQGVPLSQATWGQRNLLNLQHPISRAVPQSSRWIDMPRVPMNGAPADMPLIQAPDFGCSQRMVVSPGHEDRALCNQPAGQSGHFLSPFYRAGHEAWVRVEPLPFLPGETKHRLELHPKP